VFRKHKDKKELLNPFDQANELGNNYHLNNNTNCLKNMYLYF